MTTYGRGAFAASLLALAACSSSPTSAASGAGGATTIGCDAAEDCGPSASGVCIQCIHHECLVYSGVCK